MKQLLDNAEYANTTGVRNVIGLLTSGEPSVVEGTSFAPGAIETLAGLIERRPDLFDAEIVSELGSIAAASSDNRIRELATAASAGAARPT